MSELIDNIERIHTTPMGVNRIKRNLSLNCEPVEWCKAAILNPKAVIERKGKNYYVTLNDAIIIVNAGSYTIITAHKK